MVINLVMSKKMVILMQPRSHIAMLPNGRHTPMRVIQVFANFGLLKSQPLKDLVVMVLTASLEISQLQDNQLVLLLPHKTLNLPSGLLSQVHCLTGRVKP